MVRDNLKKLKKLYSDIEYNVVLAYDCYNKYNNTILPEGIEKVTPKFAIVYRNKWMIEQSDYVVTFVEHSRGGAARFKKPAESKKKTVINLANSI